MKLKMILPMCVLPVLVISCANNPTEENYDVSNPYAAPDYGVAEGSPFQEDAAVNPVYDSPAAYEDTAAVAPAPSPMPTRPAAGGGGATKVHTVVRGDTLWGLSRQYGVSIDAIKSANNMTRDTVMLGQRLQIPGQ